MKISNIHIDGFGVWNDHGWSQLSPTLNVFHGPNETGKTTLMSFVRSILFGFERRTHPRRYEPLRGGNYGGTLDVLADGRKIRIERKAGRHVRGEVGLHFSESETESLPPETEDGDEQVLERLLGGTTRTLYHNVFAFGLEELEHFRTLEESDVASHISGAGMGVGATRWSRVWKDIEERRSNLFLPRGQNSTINRALKELDSVRNELEETEGDPEDYVAAYQQRVSLDGEIHRLEESSRRLRKRISHYTKLEEAEPHQKRRAEIEQGLGQLDQIDHFPNGGIEQLNLLLHQGRGLEEELEDQRIETARVRAERLELASKYTPQELIRRSRGVDSLRSLLPRRDLAEERVAEAGARRDGVRNDVDEIRLRRDRNRPPSGLATIIFVAIVAAGGVGLFTAEQTIAGTLVAAALALVGVWYYWRERKTAQMNHELMARIGVLRSSEEDVTRLEVECQRIFRTIEGLSGRGDCSYVDLERENLKILELTEIADRIRSIDEKLTNEEQQRDRIGHRIEENKRNVAALFKKGGATSETEFFLRAEVFRQRKQLLDELARTPVMEVGAVPETEDIEAFDQQAYLKTVAELEQTEEEFGVARTEAGRLDERVRALGRSEDRSRARLRQESILARIDEASEEWAVLTLCRTLLDETRRVYETERQPEVLRHASEFFRKMSEDRWGRVVAGLEGDQIYVESADGTRVSPENLSRGTGEQLYLSMRLALVREYSRHVEPLPVIFDDIFVNFDPQRTRRSVEAVRELSQTHQILLFTCHPHLLELVEEIVPEAKVYPLQ